MCLKVLLPVLNIDVMVFCCPCLHSMPAVEYTKDFITSVVVGKDVVPRIGLHQLEQLRSDLMDVIKHNKQSKVT